MAETAAVGDIYQVTVRGSLEGQDVFNVWHFKCVGTTDDVEARLILIFIQCFIANLLPVLVNTYTLNDVLWKKIFPILGVEHITDPPGANQGQADAEAEPSFVSALLSMRTARGGRSFRGRKYIAGIAEQNTLGSFIITEGPNNVLWTALLNFAACVVGAFVHPDPAGGSNIWDVGVFSRKLGGSTFPVNPAGFTAVVSITPDRELATTRSRKVGRGG